LQIHRNYLLEEYCCLCCDTVLFGTRLPM
jgi:hypothetical protein